MTLQLHSVVLRIYLPLKRGGRRPKAVGWGSFSIDPHPTPPLFKGRERPALVANGNSNSRRQPCP